MKKLLTTLLLTTSILSLNSMSAYAASTQAVSQAAASSAKLADTSVVAEYGSVKVTVKDVMDQFRDLLDNQLGMQGKSFNDLDKNMRENLVRGYVNSKLIELEIASQKVLESPEFQKKLDETKIQIAQQFVIEKVVKEKVKDSDIKAEYEKTKKELVGKQEYKASHILVDSEEKAKEIKAKLAKGAKFEDLAREYSMDEGSKKNGGDLGAYFGKGQLVPEFEAKVMSMKKGEISDPVKTQFGWHIIRLDDSKAAKAPTFEEMKSQIQNKLSRDAMEGYIKSLNDKNKVKFHV